MLATGAALSCTLGCKMVGLLTFLSVGAAVMWDLWGILDVRKNPSMVSVCCTFSWARKYEGRDGKRVL